MNLNEMCNLFDELIGCYKCMCVTDDFKELIRLRYGAINIIDRIYDENFYRLHSKKESRKDI